MGSVVILIGAPGSGKGTQSTNLVNRYGFIHTSAGDLLRAEVKADTEIGRRIKDILEAGALCPDEIVNGLLFNVLVSLKNGDRLLLDGYPRTVEQAKYFDEMILRLQNISVCVIQIDVDTSSVVNRMSSRVMCEQCKTPYTAGDVERCTVCGCTSFVRRKDDEPDVVRRRIESYNSISAKVLDYYGDRAFRVDGNLPVIDVNRAVMDIIAQEFVF